MSSRHDGDSGPVSTREPIAPATLATLLDHSYDAVAVRRFEGEILALPPEPIVLDADGERLSQVFTNRLMNATEYTPQGVDILVEASADRSSSCTAAP